MILLVCGGRTYDNRPQMWTVLNEILNENKIHHVIVGGAPGADSLAGQWADSHKVPVCVYRADWEKHGRAAGPIRNAQMLSEGKPDLVIAFPGGRGTADMIQKAKAAGIRVLEVDS